MFAVTNTFIMSTQSYYKDRLGFDPREALYDGATSPPSTLKKTSIGGGTTPRRNISVVDSPQHNNSSVGQYDGHTSPAKKQRHSHHSNNGNNNSPGHHNTTTNNNNNSQGGYEDALTQFKGTMSLWDFFVENWDITGMWGERNLRRPSVSCVLRVPNPHHQAAYMPVNERLLCFVVDVVITRFFSLICT